MTDERIEALRMLDHVIPFRLRLLDKHEGVNVQVIKEALGLVRAALLAQPAAPQEQVVPAHNLLHEKEAPLYEEAIAAAIRRVCGDYRIGQQYDYEDICNIAEALIELIKPVYAQPAAPAVPNWIKEVYGYLDSTLPQGAADEAFRVAPQEVREALAAAATQPHNDAGIGCAHSPEVGRSEVAQPAAPADDVLKDAQRYRYIRDVLYTDHIQKIMCRQMNAHMDAAIDAAMAALKEQTP